MVVHSTMRATSNGVTGKKRTHSESVSSAPLTDVIFIGNPGTGKSTFINCLIGEPLFKSGLAFDGTGVTSYLQRIERTPFRWTDTPGLADTEKRELAAKEITKALKSCDGGVVRAKIFFVITLEEGRLRPADILTMTLVLESAPIKYFGIIINKLGKRMCKILEKEEKGNDLRLRLFGLIPKATQFLYYMRRRDDLEEEDNAVVSLPADFVNFIYQQPENEYKSERVEDVKNITNEEYKKVEEEFEKKMSSLRENFENEKARLQKEMEARLETEINNLKQDHARHTAALQRNLDAVKRHTQGRILRLKQENVEIQRKMDVQKKANKKRLDGLLRDNVMIRKQNAVEKERLQGQISKMQRNNTAIQKELQRQKREAEKLKVKRPGGTWIRSAYKWRMEGHVLHALLGMGGNRGKRWDSVAVLPGATYWNRFGYFRKE